MERFDISTPRRQRFFLTHMMVETQGLTKFEENLFYTNPERLAAVWPSRFTMDRNNRKLAFAPEFVRNPQKLANQVYSNRNGNGSPESGDGWRFRGRGGFHLTFANNYLDYSRSIYGDDRVFKNPDLVALPADAMMSAGWFWTRYKFNRMADADEFTRSTVTINGSASTVPTRLEVLSRVNDIC